MMYRVTSFAFGAVCSMLAFLVLGQAVFADDQTQNIDIQFQVGNQFCGNSIVDGVEECDDGNGSNTDACLNTCVDATCGDGYRQSGVEECDDGGSNGECPASCSTSCTENSCDDGGPSDPTPDVDIISEASTDSSISFTWTATGGTITGCTIEYDIDGEPFENSTTTYALDGGVYSAAIGGLASETDYFVLVSCTNNFGNIGDDLELITTDVTPESSDQLVTIIATPELRVSKPGGNDDTDFNTFIFSEDETTLIGTISGTTNATGAYTGVHTLPIGAGYVAVFKSNSHLAKKIVGVDLDGDDVTLDFTAGGTFELLAGDTSPEDGTYANLQDNVVNLLDLTYVTADGIFNVNNDIADLNRDDTVTVLDITLLLKNYNETGDVIPLVL